jgi:hypothetical protein
MTLKPALLLTLLLTIGFYCHAQTLSQINLKTFGENTSLKSIKITTANATLLVNPNGSIMMNTGKYDHNCWVLLNDDDKQQNPAVIDNVPITYRNGFDSYSKAGSLKSIDNVAVTYYDQYDGFDKIGLLKTIGNITFTYYDKYDGFDNIGKLKTIGNTRIFYYDRFDGGNRIGKVKSIDRGTPGLNVVNE